MSDREQLPELRYLHDLGTRGHYFRKILEFSLEAYYECQCGARADRYGVVIPA